MTVRFGAPGLTALLSSLDLGDVRANFPLEKWCTVRVGGAAEAWVRPSTPDAIVRLLKFNRVQGFPVSLLGRAVPPLSGQRTHDDDIEAWEASAPAADFPGSVLQVIETLSFPDQPRIGLVADAIGISVRALQRRLAEAGATFAGLIAHGRFATAVGLLEETDSTILDIALNLGYSDHAHFTRAFRRWTGIPPREFRRMSRLPRRNALRQDSLPLGRAASG